MRAWEFIETNPTVVGAGLASLGDTRKPRITLRYLNKQKLRRKRRAAEFAKKLPLIVDMYGDPERQAEAREEEFKRGEERHEVEMLKQEVQLLRDRIALDIDAAEIDTEQKQRIAQSAMRAIKHAET